ncbi:peptidoglycan editing factor PgeF [Streptacidiphilus monticola]|jgi:YfiH family protein|uniref:Purine nucleoside phosphorylase n=1 Tax=Streptacidiphilus monticola TaxID=2161674 RepID=A0ABW1G1M7_9ACTN
MIVQTGELPGARVAFTTRWGGVSSGPYASLNLGGAVGDDPAAVSENRELVAKALGFAAADVVWMNQVHGADGAIVTERQPAGHAPSVDAVVTDRPDLVLAVLTADCTPLLLVDPVARVVGAAHVGRPGLAAHVTGTVLRLMRERGAHPERVSALIGPGVCGRCYEVPADLRAAVAEDTPAAYAETSWGTPSLDIPAGVRSQLAELGVTEVAELGVCTVESKDHFSYRRERTTGRLGSYIRLGDGS